ncbi:protein disulfide isomerase, putative [Entamoeba invadens IP1]|uniref:Protein disulfide isomerase, putative n=1 Tax=Entamoeba invadens IP1 TaxID=370355 RepID=A0A0A1U0W8_ENTIV|nr:protein disulfide isomerase, putative [Entamoeba invadens IP1]ELP87527.1 protein disulfide isomerase, putative [Entamoeba invadens IP1]|eukprot:XP_004254298.1 protein disulfide isomerase, putative [Entamoeba invadens IP1]
MVLLVLLLFVVTSKKIDELLKEVDEADDETAPKEGLLELSSQTFKKITNEDKYVFVLFYDPTCPHCKKVIPRFRQLGFLMKDSTDFIVAQLDCDMYHSYCHKQSFLKGYPSLFLFHNGTIYQEYKMSYSPEAMKDFVLYLIKESQNNQHPQKTEL